ncbi:MAG: FadR/GntR family transcriptional regulator [Treponemataceae bacterium]
MKNNEKTVQIPKLDFIERMEELLLMNILLPGERLPAERDLAQQMGVSRAVIHEGLLELRSRGLIRLRSRHGWVVNDFAKDGSLSLLNSLYRFSPSPMAAQIDSDLEEVRRIMLVHSIKKYFVECDIHKKNSGDLAEKLFELMNQPLFTAAKHRHLSEIQKITEQDFLFYRCIIEAGGNMIFMLLFNSARELYHKKLETFFSHSSEIQKQAYEMKIKLIDAIKADKRQEVLVLIESMTSYKSYET